MQDAITLSDRGSSEHTLIFPYRGSLKNADCPRDLQSESHTRVSARLTFARSDCTHCHGHRTVCMPDGRFDSL
jgi:hypothetical protein